MRASLFAPTRDRAVALAWIVGGVLVALEVRAVVDYRAWGFDAGAYRDAWASTTLYTRAPNETSYLYSPVFAEIFRLADWVPWVLFLLLWAAVGVGVTVWLVRPVGWAWGIPLACLMLEDIRIGNITWLLTLCVVVGLTCPGLWAMPLLTKIAPGLVGLAWFTARRDWRAVAWVVGVTVALSAVSFAAIPSLWFDWWAFLRSNGSGSAEVRVLAAVALAVFAARSDRPWLLPAAVMVTAPVFGVYSFGYLCAVPRLLSPAALAWATAPFGGVSATLRRALDL